MDSAGLIISLIDSVKKEIQYRPLVLGGWSGSNGGTGGPPGGFIGYLPQTRVAYDTTEAEDCTIPSGITPSLLHNLNKIRCRIKNIENSLSTGSGVNISIVNITENFTDFGVLYESGTKDPYVFRSIAGYGAVDAWTDGDYIYIGGRIVEKVIDPYPVVSGNSLIYATIPGGNTTGKEIQLKKLVSTDNSITFSDLGDGRLDLKSTGGSGDSIANTSPVNLSSEGAVYISGTNNPQILRKIVGVNSLLVRTVSDTIEIDGSNFVISAGNIGIGAGVFDSRSGQVLLFRSIDNFDGKLSVYHKTDSGYNSVIIDNNTLVEEISTFSGTGANIVRNPSGPVPEMKRIKGSNGISVTEDTDYVIISSRCPTYEAEVFTVSGSTYTLSKQPSGTVQIFVNNQIENPNNYTVSGNTVTLNYTPSPGQLFIFYVTCDTGNQGYGLDAYGTSSYGSI